MCTGSEGIGHFPVVVKRMSGRRRFEVFFRHEKARNSFWSGPMRRKDVKISSFRMSDIFCETHGLRIYPAEDEVGL